jgi:hypothetical protein
MTERAGRTGLSTDFDHAGLDESPVPRSLIS